MEPGLSIRIIPTAMEEPGEQCTVVFALIVTGLAFLKFLRLGRDWLIVCVCGWGDGLLPPTLTLTKTTVHCSPGSSMPTANS
jgi:hypothetical protein